MSADNPWRRVLATHEEKQELSTGPWLGDTFPGVALPSAHALRRWVLVRYGDRGTCAQVMDVGPWSVADEDYVFRAAKPRAERLAGHPCPTTDDGGEMPTVPDGKGGMKIAPVSNGAGIDLFPAVARALGLRIGCNAVVEWKFVEYC